MLSPKLPLPEPLRGSDPDSFAQNTVAIRLPNTLMRTLTENNFPQSIVRELNTLFEEMPHAKIKYLTDSEAPDAAQWSQYLEPYLDYNWLQAPWFVSEIYFYRRLLDAIGYFKTGDGYQIDPFIYQKQKGLETSRDAIANLSTQLKTWIEQGDEPGLHLATLFKIDLWGNQADYSLWSADGDDQPNHADLESSLSHIAVNDTQDVVDYLLSQKGQSTRIDFIVDNAAFELVCDLALTDFVLASGLASTVVFHLKCHPTFVSDAMIKDVKQTIEFLANDSHHDTSQFGQRLQTHLDADRLQLKDDFYWTSPLSMWEMPVRIREELGKSNLVISKGDANYRRLLGDRHWPYTTPFSDIVSYMPVPLVAVRTFKSNVAAGLQAEQISILQKQNPDWITNGTRGVIQFVE